MKKILFIIVLAAIAAKVHAQTTQQAKPNTPAKVDTSKQDRMPVIKPNTNSTMPVMKPQNNSPMPIVKPGNDTVMTKRKIVPKR
ncbi:hypothetical protein GCM10027049_01410 [Mucilaginibacter puniceus]